jgi:membrane-associated phospholipid phosphatase
MRSTLTNKMLGLTAILVGFTGITLLWGWMFQNVGFLHATDVWLYRALFQSPHYKVVDFLSQPFNYNLFFHIPGLPEDMPTFFYFMIVGVSIYLWFKEKAQVKWFLLAVLLGNLLVHFISLVDTHFLYRERPFITLNLPIDPRSYEAWRYLSSFPSGHCRDTALYSTLIALFVKQLKWPAIVLVAFIAYVRVYLGAHYPSDVLIGTAMGIVTALVVWQATRYLDARRQDLQGAGLNGDGHGS